MHSIGLLDRRQKFQTTIDETQIETYLVNTLESDNVECELRYHSGGAQ